MFDEQGIEVVETVEARKEKIAGEDAWAILSAASPLVADRGKKIVVFDSAVDDREEILKVCLGRTGNLRAPTMRIGSLVLVGFNEAMYDEYLKG